MQNPPCQKSLVSDLEMTGLLRGKAEMWLACSAKGAQGVSSIGGCRVRQPGVPKCWLVMVNHKQRAAGLLWGALSGTTGFSALINGLEMNLRLPLIKFEDGKWVCRVISNKTAPSSKFPNELLCISLY